jgi:hypothetical protein
MSDFDRFTGIQGRVALIRRFDEDPVNELEIELAIVTIKTPVSSEP